MSTITDKDVLEKVIHLIEQSDLDRTIKDILIRDIQNEGLTDFLREQIRAFCLEGIKKLDEKMQEVKDAIEKQAQEEITQANPTE
jgi:hypothetical protein